MYLLNGWKNKYKKKNEELSLFLRSSAPHAVCMGCREEKSNHQRARLLLRKSTLWEMKCSLSLAFSQASHQETGASGAVIGPWGGMPVMQTGPPVSWNRWCLHTHLNKAVMALARKHRAREPFFANDNVFLRCSVKINIYSATNFHFRHNLSSFRASHQWTAILFCLV